MEPLNNDHLLTTAAVFGYQGWLLYTCLTILLMTCTVKLGYNELGYNEHSVIKNKIIYLVGLGHFYDSFSRL